MAMWRWVLGGWLVALIALWAYAGFFRVDRPGMRSAPVLQDMLKVRAAQALSKVDFPNWAKLEMNGQIATISGTARTEEERNISLDAVRRAGWPADTFQSGWFYNLVYMALGDKAAQTLSAGGPIWGGVVAVVDASTLAPAQSPYTWSAKIGEGGRLYITGFVPSESARKELFAQAKQLFSSNVDDQTRVARGAPKGNWTGVVSAALDCLHTLAENSTLTFSDQTFEVRGETNNPATPAEKANCVKSMMPPFRGEAFIQLTGEQVPPAVIPSEFVWSARLDANRRVLLTGYAPKAEIQAQVLQAAKTEFGEKNVDDRTEVATVAPEGDWPAAAEWALRLLSKLQTGEATFTGNRLAMSGTAEREEIQTHVTNGVRTIQPPFTGDAVILLPGQAPAAPAPAETPPPAPPPAPVLIGPQEPEAANRSDPALRCQGIVDQLMANQVIEFDSGRAAIKASSFALLDQIAAVVLDCPGLKLIVAGHTDNSGGANGNRKLSNDRARAVTAYLRNKGVANGRMTARGYGPDRPLAPNDTEEGKARNRRIQLTVID